ncbi:ACT domain-containing protein [Marinomonas sp.]|uniref:ACT domain-containing protein n=1 Tax=Marinomonas sp. TaxID=1904862 RepID=UPI003C71626B
MSGMMDLNELLSSMSPKLQAEEFVFCTSKDADFDYKDLLPVATFREEEGLTLILPLASAKQAGFDCDGVYKQITLTVHSSLEAVGLTAAIAAKLTEKGISANVVAAYYHDHIFVQKDKAEAAMLALQELIG